jgi:signal transduction histidine kinase
LGLQPTKHNTLRRRLTVTYAAALLLGFVIFSLIFITVLGITERRTLDSELLTIDGTIAALVVVRDGTLSVDSNDRMQFNAMVDKVNAAVITLSGKILLQSSQGIPDAVLRHDMSDDDVDTQTLQISEAKYRVVYLPIISGNHVLGTAITWRSLDEITRLQTLAYIACLISIILISVPAIAVSGIITQRNLRDLERITRQASEIEGDDISQRLGVQPRSDKELHLLTSAINRMLDRLEQAFSRQKRFTADASHELRTPISIIRSEAELALRSERTPQEYQATLQTISEVGGEMQTLMEHLLSAARAEYDVAKYDETIEVVSLIHKTIRRMHILADQRKVTIRYEGPDQAIVAGSSSAVQQALSSVLHNSVKFAPFEGHVLISLYAEDIDTRITVKDDGNGFTPAALEHGCERFWRDDTSRTPGSGSGLGLFLAASVLAPGGAKVNLFNDGGAVVELLFPKA